jgi:hypothetical protein
VSVSPVGGTPPPPPPPPVDPSAIHWSNQAPDPITDLNLSGERSTRAFIIQTHTIKRTPQGGVTATGIPAVIEAAGPYLVSLAALVVAVAMHDFQAVELIAGGVAGGGVTYGVARRRLGSR